jgi:hypothetical protein
MLKRFYIRDEAAREVQKGLNENLTHTFKRNLRELRYLGFGLGLGIQSPTETDETAIANPRYTIAFGCKNPHDIRLLQQMMSLPEDLALQLPMFDKGDAIIAGLGIPSPQRIYIPFEPHAGYVSRAALDARQAEKFARLEREIIRAPEAKNDQESYAYLEMLGERIVEEPQPPEVPASEIQKKFFDDHRLLLLQVQKHPGLPTAEHYRALKWGSGRGSRIKEDLLAWGLIRCERRMVQQDPTKGGRPAEIMIITPKEERFINNEQ